MTSLQTWNRLKSAERGWVKGREASKINLHFTNLNLIEMESFGNMLFYYKAGSGHGSDSNCVDPAPHFTLTHTYTPPLSSLATSSYQHAGPIKSCALNLIKPLIYIKQPISPSSLVCVSQGTLLPQEGDVEVPTLCRGLSSHTTAILVFLVIPSIYLPKTPLFFSPPPPPTPPASLLQLLSDLFLPFLLARSQQSVVRHQY